MDVTFCRFLMKYELTKKGGIQTKPLKSSDVYPHTPVVTPLNKYKILQLNNVQAPSPPTVETARASTTRREFINNSIMRPSLMHQDFGKDLMCIVHKCNETCTLVWLQSQHITN